MKFYPYIQKKKKTMNSTLFTTQIYSVYLMFILQYTRYTSIKKYDKSVFRTVNVKMLL